MQARFGGLVEPILAVEKGRPNCEIMHQFATGSDQRVEAKALFDFEEDIIEGLVEMPGAGDAVRTCSGFGPSSRRWSRRRG